MENMENVRNKGRKGMRYLYSKVILNHLYISKNLKMQVCKIRINFESSSKLISFSSVFLCYGFL